MGWRQISEKDSTELPEDSSYSVKVFTESTYSQNEYTSVSKAIPTYKEKCLPEISLEEKKSVKDISKIDPFPNPFGTMTSPICTMTATVTTLPAHTSVSLTIDVPDKVRQQPDETNQQPGESIQELSERSQEPEKIIQERRDDDEDSEESDNEDLKTPSGLSETEQRGMVPLSVQTVTEYNPDNSTSTTVQTIITKNKIVDVDGHPVEIYEKENIEIPSESQDSAEFENA